MSVELSLMFGKETHRRMDRGGGARAPKNFYGRAKSNAKFGQNFKISEKF